MNLPEEKNIAACALELFNKHKESIYKRTDYMFGILMILQWIGGILTAILISPKTWAGVISQTHIHVWAAIFLGGVIIIFPLILIAVRPGSLFTRHVIAVAQMLTSALLIHLSGGRIETHFHVFGSLAFLSFYRDWTVLISASAIVAADHIIRGLYWPQSVYGIIAVEPWRWFEHAAWVIFEDIFLIIAIIKSKKEMQEIAFRQANIEIINKDIESKIVERTKELEGSNGELKIKMDELEKLNSIMIGREQRILELKEEVKVLKGSHK